MLNEAFSILAGFTAPEHIGVEPKSMLWMIPLAAAIASVYKAIKIKDMTIKLFIKEMLILFGSIVLFIIAAGAAISLITYIALE